MHAIVCKRRKTLKSFDFLKNICHKMTMSFFPRKTLVLAKKREFSYRKTSEKFGYLLRLYTETFHSFVFIQKGLIIFP